MVDGCGNDAIAGARQGLILVTVKNSSHDIQHAGQERDTSVHLHVIYSSVQTVRLSQIHDKRLTGAEECILKLLID